MEETVTQQPLLNVHFSSLVSQLHSQGIKYFLLTDFEADLLSRDIDLYVHSDFKVQFEDLLSQLGWYKRKELPQHINHHFYFSPDLEIYLDIKYDLSFANGKQSCFTYLLAEEAIGRATLNNIGLYRPQGADAILLYAAHLAYKERGGLEQKHKQYLCHYLNLYSAELKTLNPATPSAISNWLTNSFPNHTLELQQAIASYFHKEDRPMVRNERFGKYGYGMKILFLGTDGSGKTTLIQAVQEKINLKARKLYLGMGENGWTTQASKRVYNHRFNIVLFDKMLSLVKNFILLPSEFMLRIAPVKVRSRFSLVLIDRFPGSVFMNGRPFSSFLYRTILPKPDLVFFLHAAPEVLVQRKPEELTLERSIADIKKFKQVADSVSGGNFISIDTSHITIDEARDKIIAEIYKHSKVYQNLLTVKYN